MRKQKKGKVGGFEELLLTIFVILICFGGVCATYRVFTGHWCVEKAEPSFKAYRVECRNETSYWFKCLSRSIPVIFECRFFDAVVIENQTCQKVEKVEEVCSEVEVQEILLCERGYKYGNMILTLTDYSRCAVDEGGYVKCEEPPIKQVSEENPWCFALDNTTKISSYNLLWYWEEHKLTTSWLDENCECRNGVCVKNCICEEGCDAEDFSDDIYDCDIWKCGDIFVEVLE